jgi:PBSX family phage terminase large subunit
MSTSAVLARPRERAPFMPYGAARLMWRSARREVLMAGPANTGKTRANLEKLHFCMDKYPGARGLILRKTRSSLTQSALVTYETKVLPYGWLGNLIRFNSQDQQYEYPNGSIIAVSGLNDPQRVMSSEWDFILVNEATELDEDDWQALTIRLRNKVMPYQQLLGDCNPGPPNHWLKLRCERGATLMLESRHEDNPSVTDEDLATLDALTGVWYLRYRKGLWVAAEGTVYQNEWNPAIHLIYRFELQPLWPRYWVIDFGFRNAFVWQAWAQDHDGNLYRYHEIYKTGTLVEDHAKQIMELTANEPRPVAIVCDHDAEDRATFERYTGYSTIPAHKSVRVGIQAVQSRLRVQANGKPGIFFLRDSLAEIDTALAQKRDPISTEAEFERYEWDVSNGRKISEEPIKKYDHGMDAMRYMVMHVDDPNGSVEPLDEDTAQALRSYTGY